MVEITMQVSESLARNLQSLGDWSATIVELGVANFQFSSTRGASTELIEFLSHNPSPKKVFEYFISDKHQKRLDDLLDLNSEGEISESQERELDEWMKLDHISIMMKGTAAKLIKQNG